MLEFGCYAATHLSLFSSLAKHNDDSRIMLPAHAPKIFQRFGHRALCSNIGPPRSIAVYKARVDVI